MYTGTSSFSESGAAGKLISIIAVLILLSVLVLLVTLGEGKPAKQDTGHYLHSFNLVRDDGSSLGLQDIKGKWSLVFFGYMNCPDVCPATMMQLKQFYGRLREAGEVSQLPQVIFISVDSQRDSPEKLADYVHYFDETFIGATGTKKEIDDIIGQLDAFYKIRSGSGKRYVELTVHYECSSKSSAD